MIRRETNVWLTFGYVVLLISIVLTGCGQSISHNGESIDSISSWTGSEVGVDANEKSENSEQLNVDRVSEALQELLDQSSPADVASDEQPDVEDASSDGAVNAQTDSEAPAQELSEEEAQAVQENPDVVAENQTDGSVVEDRKDDTATAGNKDEGSSNQRGDESPSSNSSNSSNNEQKEQSEWDGDNTLTFGELYASVGVRGIVLSDKVEALTDQEVEMSGYMAPPLTAGVRFFVLTKTLMAVCPFCSTDADWPTDIVVVYLPDGEEMNPTEHPVKVTGTLDTGSFRDEDTGFVSLVRIYADKVEVLR